MRCVGQALTLTSLLALARAADVCIDGEPSLTSAALLQFAKSDVPRSHSLSSLAQERSRSLHGYGLSSEIWMGLDEPSSAPVVANATSQTTDAKIHFKIMGHFNTGTHLIRELIVKAFGEAVNVASPDEVGFSDCTFWKHSPLRLVPEKNLAPCNRSSVIGISVVRNPFSWLESLHSHSYDLDSCTKGEDWLGRSCLYPDAIESVMPQLRGVSYSSVEDIWNKWTSDYTFLQPQIFNRSLVLTYESIVLNTSNVLERIANLSNVTLANVAKVSTLMAKQAVPWAEKANNASNDAAQKITTNKFMDFFKPEQIERMCSRLNITSMHRYGYTQCDVA